jgi:hypothetical protein
MIPGINYVSYECEGSPSGSNLLILPCPGEPVNWRKRTVYDGSILSVTGGGRCVHAASRTGMLGGSMRSTTGVVRTAVRGQMPVRIDPI